MMRCTTDTALSTVATRDRKSPISTRSCRAVSVHTTSLSLFFRMALTHLFYKRFRINLRKIPCFNIPHTDFDFRTQPRERVYTLQQLQTNFFLGSLGEFPDLLESQGKCLCHSVHCIIFTS